MSDRGLRHDFYLCYTDSSLSYTGTYTVRTGIPSTDDKYFFPFCIHHLIFSKSLSFYNPVLL